MLSPSAGRIFCSRHRSFLEALWGQRLHLIIKYKPCMWFFQKLRLYINRGCAKSHLTGGFYYAAAIQISYMNKMFSPHKLRSKIHDLIDTFPDPHLGCVKKSGIAVCWGNKGPN